MKEIKINLEHHELFKTMSAGGVKKIVLGLMSVAKGEEVKEIPHEIWPTFVKLREQLEARGESGEGYKEEDEVAFDKVLETYERKRMSYEEKSEALTEELNKLKEDMEHSDVLEKEHEVLLDRFIVIMMAVADNLEKEGNVLKGENALLKEMRKTPKDGNYKERVFEFLEGMMKDRKTPVAKSEDDKCVNRETEIIGSSPDDRELPKGTELDCPPPIKDVPATKEGYEPGNTGIAFPPEDWKVIDKNWEILKDAVYRIKIKKEALQDIHMPAECWKVVGRYYHELSALFHL